MKETKVKELHKDPIVPFKGTPLMMACTLPLLFPQTPVCHSVDHTFDTQVFEDHVVHTVEGTCRDLLSWQFSKNL